MVALPLRLAPAAEASRCAQCDVPVLYNGCMACGHSFANTGWRALPTWVPPPSKSTYAFRDLRQRLVDEGWYKPQLWGETKKLLPCRKVRVRVRVSHSGLLFRI